MIIGNCNAIEELCSFREWLDLALPSSFSKQLIENNFLRDDMEKEGD